MGSKSIFLLITFTTFMSYNYHVSTSAASSLFGPTDFERKLDAKLVKLQQTLDSNTNSILRTLSVVEVMKSRQKKLEEHIAKPCETQSVISLPQPLHNKGYANENLPAKLADGTIISRHSTTNKPWVQQIGDCGGVLVGEKGMVTYTGQQFTEQIRCIWTIRANSKSKINLRLVQDNLGENWLTISEYTHLYLLNNATDTRTNLNTFKIETGIRKNYTMNGPIVFLQLFQSALNTSIDPNALSSSSFTLYFEGTGEETLDTLQWKYTHYHFTKSQGLIKYPEVGEIYGSYEIVTFVWNPIPVTFKANLTNYDLEDGRNCDYDSLTIFYYTTNYWVQQYGLKNKKFRFCGEDLTNTRIGNGIQLDSLIVIFKSDVSTNKAGFQFAWDLL